MENTNLVMIALETEAKRLHHEDILSGDFNPYLELEMTDEEVHAKVDEYMLQANKRLSTLN